MSVCRPIGELRRQTAADTHFGSIHKRFARVVDLLDIQENAPILPCFGNFDLTAIPGKSVVIAEVFVLFPSAGDRHFGPSGLGSPAEPLSQQEPLF